MRKANDREQIAQLSGFYAGLIRAISIRNTYLPVFDSNVIPAVSAVDTKSTVVLAVKIYAVDDLVVKEDKNLTPAAGAMLT